MEKQIKPGSRVVFRGSYVGEESTVRDIDSYPEDAAEIGKAGTVEYAHGGRPEVRMDSGHVITGWAEERYELVCEQPEFKEGDRVVIGKIPTDYVAFVTDLLEYVGSVGEVRAVSPYDEDARVYFEGRHRDWWFPLSSLTLAESAKPAATFLIAGMTTEYTTQEAAEEFLAEFGDNGKEYKITQVVRRVRVNRTANLKTI